MEYIKFSNHRIGNKYKPFIIVEACVNHQGNFKIAKKMIYFAKKVGAQCIKFQHHIISEEMLEDNIPKSSNFKKSLSEVIKKTNFSLKQHLLLKSTCEKIELNICVHHFLLKLQKN